MNKLALLFSVFCFVSFLGNSQTYIQDKEEVYGTWTKSGSPYIVQGEAIVPKGKTLRIEPGVTVKFKTGSNFNKSHEEFDLGYLLVKGDLIAHGTHNEWIEFTRYGEGLWGCIIIEEPTESFEMSYCIIEYAKKINSINLDSGKPSAYSALTMHCLKAHVKNCIFYENNWWAINPYHTELTLENCTVITTKDKPVFAERSNVTIINSILIGNDLETTHGSSTVEVKNCLVSSELEKGTISKNNLFEVDPKFENIKTRDLRLKRDSPCIGAGTNGTDIGAIPYQTTTPKNFDFTSANTPNEKTDNAAPLITINSPRNNYRTQNSKTTIQGTATDPSGIFQILINKTETTVQSDGNFSKEVSLPNFGTNTITIKATDNNLNSATTRIQVIREKPEVKTEKRLALVIGNGDYNLDVGDLKNPTNDARDVSQKLREMNFTVREYKNLSHGEMWNVISDFGRDLKNYDVGLVYYSGHGIAAGGENYLIPSDATLNYESTVRAECINQDFILAQMEGAGSQVNIVILDACRNNPFAKSWKSPLTEAQWVNQTAPSGTFIAYATSPKKKAHDGWGDNGAYTAELLKYIDEPGLTIEQVFKKVRGAVEFKFNTMRFRQLPWESTSLRGDFYFVR